MEKFLKNLKETDKLRLYLGLGLLTFIIHNNLPYFNKGKETKNNLPSKEENSDKIISSGHADVKFNLAGPGGGRLDLPDASSPTCFDKSRPCFKRY